jgi:hypothetical protein
MDKKSYRVRNWRDYNKALVSRGSITFWFDEGNIEQWHETEKSNKRGRPQKYSNKAIHCGLMLKVLFKLTFRAVAGFIKSIMEILKLDLAVPDYTLLCKRQQEVSIELPKVKSLEKMDIVIDSTGLKIYGEGEWKVRQHGVSKRRVWRKLHLAVNSSSSNIEACELTDLGVQDCQAFPIVLDKIVGSIEACKADGSYDRFSCYQHAEQRGFRLVTPPQRNAATSKEKPGNKKKASMEAVKQRDEEIKSVRELGRKEWKIKSGYHTRSLAETAMFRFKRLLGNRLSARKLANQKIEVAIRCQILNKMLSLGMPNSVAID